MKRPVGASISGGERRRCGCCEQELPVSAFARYGTGYQSYCRVCKRKYDAAWYRANKARRQAKVRMDRHRHTQWLDSLKQGKPCADCGRTYPPYVMEWDHLPGTEKALVLADVRRAAHAKERVLAEIAKCELVCANCHRERTFGRRAMEDA
jgi:hypothetical protein